MWPWRLAMTPTGERFRFLRKLYHKVLSPQRSRPMRKYQDYESKVMLCNLLDSSERFLRDTERYALSVIFSAVYGVRLATLDHPVMMEFFSLWKTMLESGIITYRFLSDLSEAPSISTILAPISKRPPEARDIPPPSNSTNPARGDKASQAPDCFGKTLIEVTVYIFEACSPPAQMFVQVQRQENIDDEKAADILAMLIGAGAETTSSTLQWFFQVMALHPEAVRKAHEELDNVVGPNRLPTWQDEASLPYIRGLVKELHRWTPMGTLDELDAITSHAQCTEDDVYEDRLIPRGTIVFPNVTALNRDPDSYVNPDRFDPDRFRDDHLDAAASAVRKDYLKRDHYQYGFGRRLCPGINIAEASLYIVISRVLWAFDIRSRPGHTLNIYAKSAGLVAKPKPFEATIDSRGSSYEIILRQALAEAETATLSLDDIELKGVLT
ncbi:MAG: hypothetical protein M1816_001534 [Peltula sp. TS41687]|nr:MAG: hypothetical protein M1816_001534 [Peltula sp. TS41687]